MEDRTPAGFGRKFYQLNYCNGRNASKRVLYDSQHSRTAPLARPLFRCILLSTITRIYIYTRGTRHVAIIHTLCTD